MNNHDKIMSVYERDAIIPVGGNRFAIFSPVECQGDKCMMWDTENNMCHFLNKQLKKDFF